MSFDVTIAALQAIVDRSAARQERAGYFAAMYLAVTHTVRLRADAGRFADAARMERFVAGFAARYLDAHESWRSGSGTTEAWRVAFDTSERWRPVILQHLLLGINAHINLDLGVAAAELGDGSPSAVRADFDAINDVLAELVDACQAVLGDVSPWLGLVDRIGGSGDETLIRFSLRAARRQAWAVAGRLGPLAGQARAAAIVDCDRTAAAVGRRVAHPGIWASAILLLVRGRERARPADVIALLAAVRPAAP